MNLISTNPKEHHIMSKTKLTKRQAVLQGHPTAEALIYRAHKWAEAAPGTMTFVEALDAVLRDARNVALHVYDELNAQADALLARREGRVQ